jgi:putative two-component system response regulator
MNHHVMIGEKICKPLRTMRGVIPIIRHHHERWDGSGYPDGLVGNAIPYLAQVFQIIDIYDALTSERPYKRAFTPAEALDVITQETEKGWRNPKLIQQFTEFIKSTQKAEAPVSAFSSEQSKEHRRQELGVKIPTTEVREFEQ